MTAAELESGYWSAYGDFYRWSSIWKAAFAHGDLREHVRHLAYTGGWKKLEPMWDLAIRSGKVHAFLPLLETILDRFGSGGGAMPGRLVSDVRAGTPARWRSSAPPDVRPARPQANGCASSGVPPAPFLNCERQPQLAENR
jgi:hypothetical protein